MITDNFFYHLSTKFFFYSLYNNINLLFIKYASSTTGNTFKYQSHIVVKQILQEHIKEVVDIDDSTLIKILDCFFEERIARGKYLIKTPQICDYYIFICHGVLKMSFEKNDTEVINWIAFERHFFTILESYINESPSEQDLIALEDTDILIIPKVKMEVLLREYPVWQLFLL